MQTATKFAALGAGNGFPSCLPKVNVAVYDYWTTFSGVNRDNPSTSDALIAESINLGMKLYWNLYSCVAPTNVTFSSTGSFPDESSSVSYLDVSSHPRAEPMKRICGWATVSESESSSPSGRTSCQLLMRTISGVRMYNGVTTDEGNFVGIGHGSSNVVITSGSASGLAVSRVSIVGYINESTNSGSVVYDYAYVTLSGLHFVCEARAGGSTSASANAAGLTASATRSFPSSTLSSTSTITSLDFYTY